MRPQPTSHRKVRVNKAMVKSSASGRKEGGAQPSFALPGSVSPEGKAHALRLELHALGQEERLLRGQIEYAEGNRNICEKKLKDAMKPDASVDAHSVALDDCVHNEVQIQMCELRLKENLCKQQKIALDLEKATAALDTAKSKLTAPVSAVKERPKARQKTALEEIFGRQPVNQKGTITLDDKQKAELEGRGLLAPLQRIAEFQSTLYKARESMRVALARRGTLETRPNAELMPAERDATKAEINYLNSLIMHFEIKVPPVETAIQEMRQQFEVMYSDHDNHGVDENSAYGFQDQGNLDNSLNDLLCEPAKPASFVSHNLRLPENLKGFVALALGAALIELDGGVSRFINSPTSPFAIGYLSLASAVFVAESVGEHRLAMLGLAFLIFAAFRLLSMLPPRLPDSRN